MFDNISPTYDRLNHLLSLGIDKIWRKKAIKILSKFKPKLILDVATGTADFAIAATSLNPEKIIGIDISANMLLQGEKKINALKLNSVIELRKEDSENLSFADNFFDAVIVSFGVRNFENLERGLSEIRRVLKKDGVLLVLEFSKPQAFPVKQLYAFYFRYLLPWVGKLISGDRHAYHYLPASVEVFPYGKKFIDILTNTGYSSVQCIPLTFGISSIYIGQK